MKSRSVMAAFSVSMLAIVLAAVPAHAGTGRQTLAQGAKPAEQGYSTFGNTEVPQRVLALMKAQQTLAELASTIESARDVAAGAGYANAVVDADHNALTVYWHGQVPRSVTQRVAAARGQGVKVSIESAAYTKAQLRSEAQRIVAQANREAANGELRVVSAAPKGDGSGLKVKVNAAASVSAQELSSGLPVEVVTGQPLRLASRLIDSPPPYHGGAYIESATHACTSAFAVQNPASHIVTANHCGQGAWHTGIGDPIGSTRAFTAHYDVQIIDAQAVGYMYDGPSFHDGDTDNTKRVAGVHENHIGDYICTSGSYSGTRCGGKITDVMVSIYVADYGQIDETVETLQTDDQAGVGNGDSGGPAFDISPGAGQVAGRGIISAMSGDSADERPCKGVPTGTNGRVCSRLFYYVDLTIALNSVDAWITVG